MTQFWGMSTTHHPQACFLKMHIIPLHYYVISVATHYSVLENLNIVSTGKSMIWNCMIGCLRPNPSAIGNIP
jgi:hypothetical protein